MRIKGIARYPHVVNPSAPKGSDRLRYSLTLLIHKEDPQKEAISQEIENAKRNGFPNGFPTNGHTCWKDLAVEEPNNPAVADYMALSCTSNADFGRPILVDSNLQEIMDPAIEGKMEGKYVYVDVGFGTFDNVSKGVKAYLNGVMVLDEEGPIPHEALSSKPDAKSMFADVAPATAAPTATPAAPVAPAAPAASAPQYVMTVKANGVTREQYHQAGWTDEQLIQNGLMRPASPASMQF